MAFFMNALTSSCYESCKKITLAQFCEGTATYTKSFEGTGFCYFANGIRKGQFYELRIHVPLGRVSGRSAPAVERVQIHQNALFDLLCFVPSSTAHACLRDC